MDLNPDPLPAIPANLAAIDLVVLEFEKPDTAGQFHFGFQMELCSLGRPIDDGGVLAIGRISEPYDDGGDVNGNPGFSASIDHSVKL